MHESKELLLLIHLLFNPDCVSTARNWDILLENAARSRQTCTVSRGGENLSDKGPSGTMTQPKKPLPKQRKRRNLTEG